MSEPIIDLTRKDWDYHSLVFAIFTPKDSPIFEGLQSQVEKGIDVAVLFYNKNKLIGRFLYQSGNKMKFEKDDIPVEDFGNLDFFSDGFTITNVEKYFADNGDGNSLTEKLAKSKYSKWDFKFTILKK